MAEIYQLNSDMKGRYLVTTQGSEHIWDLDNMTYQRLHKSGNNAMFYDGQLLAIDEVIQWPEIGQSFYFFFTYKYTVSGNDFDEDVEVLEPRWHLSSTIKSIQLLEEE